MMRGGAIQRTGRRRPPTLLHKDNQVPLLLLAAGIFVTLYGLVHAQMILSVSPEYFLRPTPKAPPPEPLTFGSVLWGFLGCLLVGVFVGTPLILVGFLLLDEDRFARRVVAAFAIAAGVAMIFDCCLLCYASRVLTHENVPAFWIGSGPGDRVADKDAFVWAWTMDAHSCLGELLGLLVGTSYLVVGRSRRSDRRHDFGQEVLEDFALGEAIREGQQTKRATRKDVFRLLQGKP
jgi:hypothetical protein